MVTEKHPDQAKLFIIVLLALNLLFGVYIAFIKPDAYSLETMKAGGRENMKMATQLYKSNVYVEQQKVTLEQILGSMNTIDDTMMVQPEAEMIEELPVVAE